VCRWLTRADADGGRSPTRPSRSPARSPSRPRPPPPPISGSADGATAGASAYLGNANAPTVSPIKHVVVIIGENHTFDNVFATYQPPSGQHVKNLLSEGIVTSSGAPGPH
jgi:phospholipase C